MLANASVAAPRCCLRCQLRRIVLQTSRTTPLRRPELPFSGSTRRFGTTPSARQDGAEGQKSTFLKSNRSDDRKKERYRRQYPLGRIVGQEGRKQRERSETLSIKSMQQDFDVVLMQDIPNTKEPIIKEPREPSLEENGGRAIPNAGTKMSPLDEKPTQEEVNASINEIRPETHTIDHQKYDDLSKQLLNGYNFPQLLSYLKSSQAPPVKDPHDATTIPHRTPSTTQGIQKSEWQPGQTPLERRLGGSNGTEKSGTGKKQYASDGGSSLNEKATRGRKKERLVEEILRSAWNISVDSNEQQLGELELVLQRWQMRYLFDLRWRDRPNYERLIQQPFLLRAARIEPYHAENVVRITGRRQDAEEIAGFLEQALLQVGITEIDLGVFKPMLGRPGWPKQYLDLLSGSQLDHIGQVTTSVIERGTLRKLYIYRSSEAEGQRAKHFLLSLLPLPSPTSATRVVSEREQAAVKKSQPQVPVLEGTAASLHLRHRHEQLYRMAVPSTKAIKDSTNVDETPMVRVIDNINKYDESLAVLHETILSAKDASRNKSGDGADTSYWNPNIPPTTGSWEVQLCRILHPAKGLSAGKKTRAPTKTAPLELQYGTSIIQPHIPGVDALLSFFSPKAGEFAFDDEPSKPPGLIAHFFPSPYGSGGVEAMRKLPRVEMCFDLNQPTPSRMATTAPELVLSRMTAILAEQNLHVTLPSEAADLRVVRRIALDARIAHVETDTHVRLFIQTLRQSMASGEGALKGEPVVKIGLPAWAVGKDVAGDPEDALLDGVEVEYLFERFEQVQSADFQPLRRNELPEDADAGMKDALEGMSDTTILESRAVEGGAVGGSRMELILKNDLKADKSREQTTSQLVDSALGLARCLTRINAGQLLPRYTLAH